MDNSGKYSLLLNFTPKESEVMNTIRNELSANTNVSDNKNEILRRGLHSFRYLIEMDNYILLTVLSDNLKSLRDSFEEDRFNFIKDLALSIYSSMISKKGVSESELFEPVVLNIQSIEKYRKEYRLNNEDIRNIIDHVVKSIDVIFLGRMDMASKFKQMGYFYDAKALAKTRDMRSELGSHIFQMLLEFFLLVSLSETKYTIKANIDESSKERIVEEKPLPSSSHEIIVKTIQK